MRLGSATPRFLTPAPRAAAVETANERELRLVREEAARQMAGATAPTGGARAGATPDGLSGALSHLFGTVSGLFGAPAAAGNVTGALGGLLEKAKEGVRAVWRGIGSFFYKLLTPAAPAANWETGLPPVGVAPTPAPAPQPPRPPVNGAAEALKRLTPEQLAALGKTDKAGFFAALRPAAEETQRQYGVPASVILAQAALETGWGQHIIPGYNIFGHKGTGPAGTVKKRTWEVINGKTVWIDAGFAKYHNFYEAVSYAGKRYHNGYYDKAVANYAKYHDPERFARDITGIYATDPAYGQKLISIMRQYKLNG